MPSATAFNTSDTFHIYTMPHHCLFSLLFILTYLPSYTILTYLCILSIIQPPTPAVSAGQKPEHGDTSPPQSRSSSKKSNASNGTPSSHSTTQALQQQQIQQSSESPKASTGMQITSPPAVKKKGNKYTIM